MSNKKKSFLLHIDSLDILDDLTNGQAGVLFKAIKAYQKEEEFELDSIVKIAFSPFKNQFSRDDDKYSKTCERRAIAGSKGGKQKVANASNCKQEVANVADTKNKNKNKTKNKSDNDKEVIVTTELKIPKFNFKNEFINLGVDKDVLDDWLIVRKSKKSSNTQTAFTAIFNEVTKSGLSFADAIKFSAENGWSGFKIDWVNNLKPVNKSKSTHTFEDQNYTSGKF